MTDNNLERRMAERHKLRMAERMAERYYKIECRVQITGYGKADHQQKTADELARAVWRSFGGNATVFWNGKTVERTEYVGSAE